MSKTASPTKLYYGWIVVATTFFMAFMTVGARNGFGVFVIPMSNELGWNRGLISLASAIAILVNGVSQPFLGRLYDRLGGRKVILTSLVILGLGNILLAFTNHIVFLILVFGIVMALAMSGGSNTMGAAIITKWFRRRRATALSMMSAGSALGGVILVPFAAYLIGLIDWRLTWVTMGLLILLLVVPLAFFFLREEPGDLGLLPDGDPAPSGRAGARALSEPSGPLVAESWRGAFRSLPIWQLCGAYFVCGFTTVVMATHMVPYAVDRGFSASTGAAAFGFMMALNLPAVLVLGVLADRFGRKNLLTLVYTLRGCGYVVLLLAPGQLGLWGFAALAGLTWVATLPLTNSLIAEVYGLRHIGILSGMAFAAHQIGGAVSIQFAGIMRDVTGSYTVPFTIAGLVLIVATLASFSIQEKKYSTRRLAVSTPAAYVE